ncbi:MAG: hypothetical protein RR986_09050 [Longicatena sp.]
MNTKCPTNQAVINASDNEFVEDLNGNRIVYTKDFYVVLYKKLTAGMDPLEAYESMGFSVETLGKDRAYAAARRAKNLGNKIGYTIDASNYDGSISRDKMGELNKDEELAYMKARTLYLESMVELQKKMPFILEDVLTSLKNEKQ